MTIPGISPIRTTDSSNVVLGQLVNEQIGLVDCRLEYDNIFMLMLAIVGVRRCASYLVVFDFSEPIPLAQLIVQYCQVWFSGAPRYSDNAIYTVYQRSRAK